MDRSLLDWFLDPFCLCDYRLGTRSVQQPVSPLTEDEDVATERKRVLRGADDVLTIENLTKVGAQFHSEFSILWKFTQKPIISH